MRSEDRMKLSRAQWCLWVAAVLTGAGLQSLVDVDGAEHAELVLKLVCLFTPIIAALWYIGAFKMPPTNSPST